MISCFGQFVKILKIFSKLATLIVRRFKGGISSLRKKMSLLKTRAIVLHYIKYSDNSIIVHCYTQHSGRMSFIVSGVYSKKTNLRINYFQPLYILDLEIYFQPKRELQRIKELKNVLPYEEMTENLYKSTVSLFLAEILYKSLRESEPNALLFDFISKSLSWYDQQKENYFHFHLLFLLNLTRYLGFYPNSDHSEFSRCFNLKEGQFEESLPIHRQVIVGEVLSDFIQLMDRSVTEAVQLSFDRDTRNSLLSALVDYYQIHLSGLGAIHSLSILQEVFSS